MMPSTNRDRSSAQGLARARLCYDHLAGQLGVALADGMTAAGWVAEGLTEVTEAGAAHLESHGVDVTVLRGRRRPVIRPCVDWTERRPHIAGALGAALADVFLQQGWVERTRHRRGLAVTPDGVRALRSVWQVELPT